MNGAPTVSAIITAWRRERYWLSALRSVLAQTVPPDEIIIVKTRGLNDYFLSFHNVRVIVVEDSLSMGAMLAAGMYAATGQVLAFLDDDDEWFPWKVARIKEAFQHNPNIVAFRNERVPMDSMGEPISPEYAMLSHPVLLDPFSPQAAGQWNDGIRDTCWNLSTYAIRHYTLSKVRHELSQIQGGTDFFVLMAALQQGPVLFTPECLTRYRVHDGNASHATNGHQRPEDLVRRYETVLPMLLRLDRSPLSRAIARGCADSLPVEAAVALGRFPTLREWLRYGRYAFGRAEPWTFHIGVETALAQLRSKVT